MPSFIQETRYGENILIAICVLGLLAAILCLFQDQYIRRVGLFMVAWMFGSYKLADWLYYRLLP